MELATGEKPFKGGEGIGTLLFQIANDPHPNPLDINPALPASFKGLIDKGMAKNPDERFSRGSEMAAAVRTVLAELSAGRAPAAVAAPTPVAPRPVNPERTVKLKEFDIPELDEMLRKVADEASSEESA
jgi:serine/threonine-protein kinase